MKSQLAKRPDTMTPLIGRLAPVTQERATESDHEWFVRLRSSVSNRLTRAQAVHTMLLESQLTNRFVDRKETGARAVFLAREAGRIDHWHDTTSGGTARVAAETLFL